MAASGSGSPLFHFIQNGAQDAAGYASLDCLLSGGRHVLLKLMGKSTDRQGLKPDAAGASQSGEEDPIATEDHVLKTLYDSDLEVDTGLKSAYMAGMDAQG